MPTAIVFLLLMLNNVSGTDYGVLAQVHSATATFERSDAISLELGHGEIDFKLSSVEGEEYLLETMTVPNASNQPFLIGWRSKGIYCAMRFRDPQRVGTMSVQEVNGQTTVRLNVGTTVKECTQTGGQ